MSLDNVHRDTPTLAVADPRGLAVRAIQYHRRQAADPVEMRVTHQCFDGAGRPVASRDPHLFALAQNDASVPANISQVFSLSGVPLASNSVDAGWRVALHGAAGQRVEAWDGRGSHSLTEFDELLRPVAVRERGKGIGEHVLERFTYAGVEADAASRNQCGQLMRHDDPAGTLHLRELGIAGALLQQTRHFLLGIDAANWPENAPARDALLEPTNGATTALHYAASGELLQQIDAPGNRQRFTYTVAAELKDTRLTLAGTDQTERTLVSDLQYNAFGQIESETAGNGVITRHQYDPAEGRLIVLSAHKANGTPLQDLKYRYDAVGNVQGLEDAAQPIRYFNNQRIEPIKTYCYDTLYQLIEATGWEAKTGHGGPALPDLHRLPLDPTQIAHYTQTYHYDAGGNLLDLVHVGAQAHGRTLTRARYSNRCMPERNGRPPTEAELAAGFDANGNLRELQAGRSMDWDLRNQLSTVRPVVREDGDDDYERYIYDGGDQRVRKLRTTRSNARTLNSEVRYLPGVEIRSHGGTGEVLHVITARAGSNSVQVLHWVAKPSEDIANDQVRYSLNDHLQSSALELDQNADLISQEWYYPYGGTACFTARSATEAKYKTVRYSGKERDATGLYYYGFRYYAPWLQRWVNPDPAGYVDGSNLFSMVGNRPVSFGDANGNAGKELTKKDLDSMVNTIKKSMNDLSEEDTVDVINDYLRSKGADPQQYLDQIKSSIGLPIASSSSSTPAAQSPPQQRERNLTENEKKGIHLFWSTNAGARYINGVTRDYFTEGLRDIITTPNIMIDLKTARQEALRELRTNNGSAGTIKLTDTQRKQLLEPALELFSASSNNAKRTVSLMGDSLGAPLKGELYRGARLTFTGFRVGDIVETSGFTSFTPNKNKAIEFMKKYHDDAFASSTNSIFFVTKGALSVNNTFEAEGVFLPGTSFKITDIFREPKTGLEHVMLEKTKAEPTRYPNWI
ncbi:insecticidal toxin complex protein TccC [Pseudomonas laurylsulfativorans]|uniref:RHS repeat-associated core domain-containing protein n=1 Tax=Pseudomonas laurylsulfativorans TaxID=1943631 RepID=UPI00209E6E82|nr:RHS repeat-associated core domain-containing protein [Pseudomonas laurylsulfativorans]MCP1419298.1 insecticidal toxin complex protein TccC [Pseudomonas laurylsulfativorans]